jgi:large subunit ribosomal protein L9
MQAILKKDLHPLGQKGQAVQVKPGYFRNFLFPQGLAVAATKKLLVKAAEVNQKVQEEQARLKREAEKLRETLKETTLKLKEKLTKKGTLFAKVSAKEIAQALEAQANVSVRPDQVVLAAPIKNTGTFEVDVKLSSNVTARVRLVVEGVE